MKPLEIAQIVINLVTLVRAAAHPTISHDQISGVLNKAIEAINHLQKPETPKEAPKQEAQK